MCGQRLQIAKHNAEVYGVADKIEFVQGDFLELAATFQVNNTDTTFDNHYLSDATDCLPENGEFSETQSVDLLNTLQAGACS